MAAGFGIALAPNCAVLAKPLDAYVGAGGVLSFNDDSGTALGEGGFSLVGKIGFTENFALHNSIVFSGDTSFLLTLTGGIPIREAGKSEPVAIPFAGAGVALHTGDSAGVDPLLVFGVDVPIVQRLVGTARLNLGFADGETDVGLQVGVGYRFKL
jgi:hypothetical protein